VILARREVLAALGAGLGTAIAPGVLSPIRAAAPPLRIAAGELTQGGWARGEAAADVSALTLDGVPVAIEQGRFFIAFDRDAGASMTLSANRGAFTLPLAIAPRSWKIESINAPFHPPGVPDAEFARLRTAELARIVAARAMVTGAQGWRQRFAWPLTSRISGLFGAQRIFRGADGRPQPGAYHPGIDLAAATGTPYHAPADGVVILAAAASPFTLEGHLLMVDHGAGLNSAFLHGSELLVAEGDSVRQGQAIGRVGMTGRATGPHLHWALRWHDARLDPLLLAGPMPPADPSQK
jgi:murein DD-endopeptidase MepM/ murein hydrolase activator NlpD